ncbi:hypothetical protein HPP92_001798 [Vanilla planifolia]|uniref:Uncharacterized protein n=1 Tax=Vanilla planifolia TaxID=51239 RepID=A0A835VFP0_VANPL|nr:hypothetical protein HPP92_001798 [Vanilla planifolia]
MDGANGDNESPGPPPHFPGDPPFLKCSRKKRKKKRWEFHPGLPVPGTRSSSSSVPPSPPPPLINSLAWNARGVANNATIGRLKKLISSFSIERSYYIGTIH